MPPSSTAGKTTVVGRYPFYSTSIATSLRRMNGCSWLDQRTSECSFVFFSEQATRHPSP